MILAQGTLDAIAAGQTPRYLAAVPGARFVPLFGGGHAPQSDTPDAILRLVDQAVAAAASDVRPGDEPWATVTLLRPDIPHVPDERATS